MVTLRIGAIAAGGYSIANLYNIVNRPVGGGGSLKAVFETQGIWGFIDELSARLANAGITGVSKSVLALLAYMWLRENVSTDSVQVFKNFNIGI